MTSIVLHCTAACLDKMLEAGAANARDKNGCTALHLATSGPIVSRLLAALVDVNIRNNQGRTALITLVSKQFNAVFEDIDAPLLHAIRGGRPDRIRPTRRIEIDSTSPSWDIPLLRYRMSPGQKGGNDPDDMVTIGDRKHEVVSALLENSNVDVNMVGDDGRSAIFFSCSPEMVCMLTQARADLHVMEKHGMTALHQIASDDSDNFPSAAVAAALVSAGATVNCADHSKQTPLHCASVFGQTAVVEVLVGAENLTCVNHQDTCGDTALHCAIRGDIVTLLLQAKASPNCTSTCGHTPAHKAALTRNVAVAQALADGQADMNVSDNDGCTPLHYASMNGVDIVEAVLGSAIDCKDSAGETPLYRAIHWGCTAVVRVLLEARAALNTYDLTGSTPLHAACASDKHDIVKILIDYGADMEARKQGCTPLHIAAASGKIDVIQILLQSKANVNAEDDNGETPLQYAGTRPVSHTLLIHGALVKRRRRPRSLCCGN